MQDIQPGDFNAPKGFAIYRVSYRTDHDPAGGISSGDVRATVTVGDTVFHDGWDWGVFTGPFTLGISKDRNRASCFVKSVYLPAGDARFAPGAQLPIRLNFARTRQRFTRTVTVTVGGRDSGKVTPEEVARVRALGCTPNPLRQRDIDNGDTIAFFTDSYTVSPGSLVHPPR